MKDRRREPQLHRAHLEDQATERLRRSVDSSIDQLQATPLAGSTLVEGVTLVDGQDTPVPRRHGRRGSVFVSAIRGATSAGSVIEVSTSKFDPEKYVVLRATGFSTNVIVDLLFV